MNFTHALAQAAKHERWHRKHPEGGCEFGCCEQMEPAFDGTGVAEEFYE